DGKTLASGWCDSSPNAKSDGRVVEWSFAGWDDTVLLSDALAWPNPSAPIENQGRKEDVRTGPASNRIRDYFLDRKSVVSGKTVVPACWRLASAASGTTT